MTKKQILGLVGCAFFGVALLFILFALSPFAADVPRHSFERNFDERISVRKLRQVDLKVNSFYLAGETNNTLYLGSYSGPLHLVQVGLPLLDTFHINVRIKDLKIPDDYRTFRMKVDSPYFFLSHGVMPGLFKGDLMTQQAISFLPHQPPYFIESVPISPTLVALKSRRRQTKENELATLKVDSPYFEFKPNVLEKQIDGIFCVDGNLHYDRQLQKLVYVYGYRNEYMVMDTIMEEIRRFHTIDTFSVAPIKVAQVKSGNYSTLASPPAKTNVRSSVYRNLLFIQSPLLAKNEDKVEFQRSSPIDVYDILLGKYLYSFHLNSFQGQQPSSFTVINGRLAAIYDHYLILYKLNLPSG